MLAIPSMNDAHLEETLLINKLEVAVNNNGIDAITEILKELLAHTSMHYYDEEDMMEEALFPAYKTHKKEHDRHLGELKSVIAYFEKHQDPSAIHAYIEGSLTPWILHHADTMDKMLALFLEEGATTACSATKGCTTGNC
jgi:hemerythrin-like metal-binding protein